MEKENWNICRHVRYEARRNGEYRTVLHYRATMSIRLFMHKLPNTRIAHRTLRGIVSSSQNRVTSHYRHPFVSLRKQVLYTPLSAQSKHFFPRISFFSPKFKKKLHKGRSMFIQTETTPNEDSLKFIPGVDVMGSTGGTVEFLDTRSSLASPLATLLMGVQGVSSVFYGPDFISITKDSENPWSIVKPEIYSILMEHFSSGQSLFRSIEDREQAGPQDTRILDSDTETVAMIKELLETRVRPAIMEDGGDIEYRGFEETNGVVKVKLKGSCRGCDSSTVTLKTGIERMLRHYIPEVKGVEQVCFGFHLWLNEFDVSFLRFWVRKRK